MECFMYLSGILESFVNPSSESWKTIPVTWSAIQGPQCLWRGHDSSDFLWREWAGRAKNRTLLISTKMLGGFQAIAVGFNVQVQVTWRLDALGVWLRKAPGVSDGPRWDEFCYSDTPFPGFRHQISNLGMDQRHDEPIPALYRTPWKSSLNYHILLYITFFCRFFHHSFKLHQALLTMRIVWLSKWLIALVGKLSSLCFFL